MSPYTGIYNSKDNAAIRTIRFRGTDIQFTRDCAVCLNSAHETIRLERTFIFGRRSALIALQVPLCTLHRNIALAKSPAQVLFERLIILVASIFGLAAATILFYHWQAARQGSPLWTFPLALVVGISLGFTIWAAFYFWLQPRLATRETRHVRGVVRLVRYDPWRNLLDVRFENGPFAEITARNNLSSLDIDKTNLKRYHIEAAIHSSDVRLTGELKTDVLLDHQPAETEARDLLEPNAKAAMAHYLGEDCFYEVIVSEINPVPLT